MTSRYGVRRSWTVHPAAVALGLLVAAAILVPGPAWAQSARVRDWVTGTTDIQWSEGLWTLNNNPVSGCVTFPGGTTTGPGQTRQDSLICTQVPNGWHWSATIPGPRTITWDANNLPVGVEVCVDIFFSDAGDISAQADYLQDWLTVRSVPETRVLYDGPLSEFKAEEQGFLTAQARRCALVLLMTETGACCNTATGTCTVLSQEECDRQTYPHTYPHPPGRRRSAGAGRVGQVRRSPSGDGQSASRPAQPAQMTVVPGGTHGVLMSKAPVVNEHILAFLGDHGSRPT